MSLTTTTRILRAHLDVGRSLIAGGEDMPDQAIADRLVRAGIGWLSAADLDPLTALRLCGRPVVFACGLTLVAHYTAPRRRVVVAVDRDQLWAVSVDLLPAIVEAVEACESAEEAVGAIYGLVPS